MNRKEKFKNLLKKHGYKSVNAYCIENKLNQSNFNNRLNKEEIRADIDSMFSMANTLHEPIEVIIEIFYPDEYRENRALMKEDENE